MVGGRRPLGQADPVKAKSPIFSRYSLVAPQLTNNLSRMLLLFKISSIHYVDWIAIQGMMMNHFMTPINNVSDYPMEHFTWATKANREELQQLLSSLNCDIVSLQETKIKSGDINFNSYSVVSPD